MTGLESNLDLNEKLESFLVRACEAEERGDQAKAERIFRAALFYEAKSCSSVVSTKEYIEQAMPVYQKPLLKSQA